MDAIKFLFEAQPIRTKLPVGRLLNTKHGQNSIRANDINTEHGIEVDKQCSSTKPMFKERDTPSQKTPNSSLRFDKPFLDEVHPPKPQETLQKTTKSTDVAKVPVETAGRTVDNQERRWFHRKTIGFAEKWPVYSYTVRNIGPLCSQYLKFAKKTNTSSQDIDVMSRIYSLAKTAKFTDCKNKLPFEIICTELADARSDMVKWIKEEFDDQTEVQEDLFCPVVIMTCKEDTACLKQYLDSLHRLQRSVVVVFLKDDNEQFDHSSSCFSNTIWTFASRTDKIFAGVDKLLMERLVFQLVLNMTEYLITFVQTFEFVGKRPITKDLKNTACQLLYQIQAMYSRSDIPDEERPNFTLKINPDLTKEFVSEILSIPNVIGCGEVFGVLEIAVNKEIKHDGSRIAENVQMLCEKNSLHEFYVRVTSKKINFYTNCGAEIGKARTSTLGAFAKAKEIDNLEGQFVPDNPGEIHIKKTKLLALISNHFAKYQPEKKLYCDGNHIADILNPLVVDGADIAAAEVLDQYREICRQVFKTQGGMEAPCLLLGNLGDLQTGEIVHIWGAKSKPGLGKIISSKYYLGKCVEMDTSGHFIIITDKSNELRFAQPGDSGSIICVTSKDGTTVFAVGMLMGEFEDCKSKNENKLNSDESSSSSDDNNSTLKNKDNSKIRKTRYCAFELQYGISRLKEAYRLEIEWLSTRKTVSGSKVHYQD